MSIKDYLVKICGITEEQFDELADGSIGVWTCENFEKKFEEA